MTTSTIQFQSRDKTLFFEAMDKNYDIINFISKYFYFKKA